MPKNVRNYWITADIDGRNTKLKGGPAATSGGFSLVVHQRDDGSIEDVLTVTGNADADGTLRLVVRDGAAESVFEHVTQRNGRVPMCECCGEPEPLCACLGSQEHEDVPPRVCFACGEDVHDEHTLCEDRRPRTCEYVQEMWGPHEGCREFMTEPEAVVCCTNPATRIYIVEHHVPPVGDVEREVMYACDEHTIEDSAYTTVAAEFSTHAAREAVAS